MESLLFPKRKPLIEAMMAYMRSLHAQKDFSTLLNFWIYLQSAPDIMPEDWFDIVLDYVDRDGTATAEVEVLMGLRHLTRRQAITQIGTQLMFQLCAADHTEMCIVAAMLVTLSCQAWSTLAA